MTLYLSVVLLILVAVAVAARATRGWLEARGARPKMALLTSDAAEGYISLAPAKNLFRRRAVPHHPRPLFRSF